MANLKINLLPLSHESPCQPFLQPPGGHIPVIELHGPVKQLHVIVQLLPKYQLSQATKLQGHD